MSALPSFLMSLFLLFSPPADSPEQGLWIGLSDAWSLGSFGRPLFPIGSVLNPRLELGWGEVSLGICWMAVPGIDGQPSVFKEGGLSCLDLGAAAVLGPWRPRMALGWGWAGLKPLIADDWEAFRGFSLLIAPLRFSFSLDPFWDLEASALELRWGPLFPPARVDMTELGSFVAVADILRVGLRYHFRVERRAGE